MFPYFFGFVSQRGIINAEPFITISHELELEKLLVAI
jgi:hypothetical protein